MSGADFMARLCALVPAPRFPLVRYGGVLSANHHLRRKVVRKPGETGRKGQGRGRQLVLFHSTEGAAPWRVEDQPKTRSKGAYLTWSELLRRVFEADLAACENCGGGLTQAAEHTGTSVGETWEGDAQDEVTTKRCFGSLEAQPPQSPPPNS